MWKPDKNRFELCKKRPPPPPITSRGSGVVTYSSRAPETHPATTQDRSARQTCSAVMQIRGPTSTNKIQVLLLVLPQRVQSPQIVRNLPLTLSPVLPTLSAGKKRRVGGNPDSWHRWSPLFCCSRTAVTRIRGREEGGGRQSAQRRQYYYKRGREENSRISPNSPPNTLYWWFKGRSLLVSTEPNASSTVTVCPLL